MPTRSRKNQKAYNRYAKTKPRGECDFCKEDPGAAVLATFVHFRVIDNLFPYIQWDGQGVISHILLTPKRHVDTLAELTKDEAAEYVKIVAEYEADGYDIYARAPVSNVKSVPHQHTHLIKLDRHSMKFMFYLHRPYFVFKR